MTGPVRQRNYSEMSVAASSAWSFEFVAKPEEAADAVLHLPAAIQSGLEDFSGLASSLVMVSASDARLITVIIFWQEAKAQRSCAQSARRLRALLAPCLDRCLRVQNLLAHRPTAEALLNRSSSIDRNFITSESIAQEANVCVA